MAQDVEAPENRYSAGQGPAVHRVPWYRSLRTRLLLWIGLGCTAVLLTATLLVQERSARLLMEQSKQEMHTLAEQTALALGAKLESVQVRAATLREAVHGLGRNPGTLDPLLRATVAGDDDIAGAMLILEGGALATGDEAYSWYVRRDGEGYYTQRMRYSGYDYRDQAWWRRTVAEGRPWWSEPYRNLATGDEMFVTYNLPIRTARDDQSPVVGMVSLDLPVQRLRALIGGQSAQSDVQRIVLSPEGMFVVHPDPTLALVARLDQQVQASGNGRLQPLLAAVRARQVAEVTHVEPGTQVPRIGLVYPVRNSAWTVWLSVSEQHTLDRMRQMARAVIAGGLLAVVTLVLLLWLIARPITKPLLALTASAGHFAAGEFDWPLPHTTRRDEVGLLARAYDRARGSIKLQLAQIDGMASARQKLESELAIAHDIQQAMLPAAPTLEAGGRRLQAHAVLEPAKEVGGDFYSFLARDASTLWFAIGDVSDKGVPAALFMARAMTVLDVAAGLGGSPAVVLRIAAQRLIEGNDTCMFATVLCGLVDTSGALTLASAGHEPPLLLHADGRVEFLPVPTGPPLGFEVADAYSIWQGSLQPGDCLVAYTDGITEAFNSAQQAFGEERLAAAVRPGDNVRKLCDSVVDAAHAFAGDAPQSDDITVLALGFDADPE